VRFDLARALLHKPPEALVKRHLLVLLVASSCTSGSQATSDSEAALRSVGAIAILQRAPRMSSVGDVFQYTSYVPGARLVKLAPPTANGTRTTLCCDQFPEMAGLDIQSYDVSFDARSIVFSGRITGDDHYGLYLVTLTDKLEAAGPPAQIATDAMRDYVYPIFAPKDRIVFVTNEVVEPGAKQHRDEYERGTTTQLGSIGIDGSAEVLGPRNLSHRTAPTMLSDGRVLFTQWDHLGEKNEGNLMIVNPDMTTLREAFGKEGTGMTNSYLKAVEVEPFRLVAIGTSRDRTIQAGKLLDIRLGEMVDGQMLVSEAHAHAVDLTPDVPADRDPSPDTVGRYYSAWPVKRVDGTFGDQPLLLVSWANGPVEEELNGAAGVPPDFGVYLYDSATRTRLPILNDTATWDVQPKPLFARAAPTAIDESAKNGYSDDKLLMGSLDVSVSTLVHFNRADAYKVRVIEGFSVEEIGANDFGLTEHEGAAMLGEVPVFTDGSWAALVPPNIPIHLQPIDRFGMALANEPVWISGRGGESRFCGGCHEDRAKTTVIQPGITMAIAKGPNDLYRVRADRINKTGTYTAATVVGVPWEQALQPMFTAKCASCHHGDPATEKCLTFTDKAMNSQQFCFDLSPGKPNLNVAGGEMLSAYSKSHLSMLGPMMGRLEENGVTVTGDMPNYIEPGSAHASMLFQFINPPQRFPQIDTSVRLHPTQPADHHGVDLTPDEYDLLILMADMGGQYYARESGFIGGGY
jgi:hypothetical protein